MKRLKYQVSLMFVERFTVSKVVEERAGGETGFQKQERRRHRSSTRRGSVILL